MGKRKQVAEATPSDNTVRRSDRVKTMIKKNYARLERDVSIDITPKKSRNPQEKKKGKKKTQPVLSKPIDEKEPRKSTRLQIKRDVKRSKKPMENEYIAEGMEDEAMNESLRKVQGKKRGTKKEEEVQVAAAAEGSQLSSLSLEYDYDDSRDVSERIDDHIRSLGRDPSRRATVHIPLFTDMINKFYAIKKEKIRAKHARIRAERARKAQQMAQRQEDNESEDEEREPTGRRTGRK